MTNPNGANQYQLDPRQKLCWDSYANPKSGTFGNALQSALKAGYDSEYSANITSSTWFCEKLRRLNMLGKAEKVLDDTLEMDDMEQVLVGEQAITKRNPAITRIKQDTAKFLAERLGKDSGYSTRTEQTGKDGTPIQIITDPTKAMEITKEYEEKLKANL